MDDGIEVVVSMMSQDVTEKKKRWLTRERGKEFPGTGNCRSKWELRTKVKHTPHADVNPWEGCMDLHQWQLLLIPK